MNIVSYDLYSLSIVNLLISALLVVVTDARLVLPPNVTFPALIGFGDSIIDPGNNNDIVTIVKCNFPPYGMDFMGGQSTGRFCNGRIPTDLLAEELGLKRYVPAYLDPNLKDEELLTGVSFASGASGYDPLTSTTASAIPLSEQLNMFQEYKEKLRKMVGPERTDFIISKSIYLVVAGSDDIANNYFGTPPLRRLHYDFDSYSDLMLTQATSFVKELYGLGARRIAVLGAPPIGCVPSQRTLGGGPTRECAGDYNTVATLFNSKLSTQTESLRSTLPNSRIVYVDIYSPILDIVQYPSKYGIKEVTKGCCGTGIIEVSVLCNKFDPVCEDDTEYLFWDSYHPTERGYKIIVSIFGKYIDALI